MRLLVAIALLLVPVAGAVDPLAVIEGAVTGLGPDETDRVVAPIFPGREAPTDPAPPEEGFADDVRAAFGDRLTTFGLASAGVALLGLAGFALVTRHISPKEALKNPQRAMIYGFVRASPGVHLKKLSEEFAMKTSSILWHVRKLEAADLVRSERANGYRMFYPVEGGMEAKKVGRALATLRNRNAIAIYNAVQGRSGIAAADIATRLSINAGTVRWHLRKMRDFGLVDELVRHDGSLYFGTPLGRKALTMAEGEPTTAKPMGVAA